MKRSLLQYRTIFSPPVTAAPLIASIISLVIDGYRGEISDNVECLSSFLVFSSAQNTGSAPVTMAAIVGLGTGQVPEKPTA
ncbi:hypothetical protein A8144_13285 [Mycobacterium leprae 3125609]|nr:hypothetical protein A8144_13285 [Mycobacterium leprae 3125609]OAX70201.1 hypothetical protein A3216_13350 [Mycobacterium leprae 7935681]